MERTITTTTNYKVTKCSESTLHNIAEELHCSINEVPSMLRNYKWKYLHELKIREWHNIVPSVVRDAFALLITWTAVSTSFNCNYCALWTWSSTPLNTDVTLDNETIRWTFSNRYSVWNTAFFDKFWASTEVWWTSVTECWLFIDWTWTANTWLLLSRVLMNESMTTTETLTVNASITIS